MSSPASNPDPQRDEKLRELFDHAAGLPGPAREQYLAEACGDDTSLRREVETLLRFDDGGDGNEFSSAGSQLMKGVAREPAAAGTAQPASPLGAAEKIGNYTILREIGAGGMGIVYLAEQEQPRRTVALKVMRESLFSRNALLRFTHESEVLGFLDHPGIAKIIEASTALIAGRMTPFFAMEYVKGIPIIAFAKARALDIDDRLNLFLQVCDAMHHAHQKGIIHRDLKPGNILVDETGQAKILDFGVARATGQAAPLGTLHTYTGQLIGTLAYMSPEQASGDSSAADTRSDVYALGVILYELLAGSRPYDVDLVPVHEAVAIIRDREATSLGSVDRRLRGDVSTIVAKALVKDKEHRYQSAAELAADIRRHLQHEPISARPTSAMYFMRKYAKRHKALIGAGALALAALVIGSVVALAEGIRASREAERAQAMNEFLSRMLISPSPDKEGPDAKLSDLLDHALAELKLQFADRPDIRMPLQATIATSYSHLHLDAKSRALCEENYEWARSTYGEEAPETILALHGVVTTSSAMHDYRHALELGRKGLELSRKVLGDDDMLTIEFMNEVGRILACTKDKAEGLKLLREAVARLRKQTQPDERGTLLPFLDYAGMTNDDKEQIALYEELLPRFRAAYPEYHPLRMRAETEYAQVLDRESRHEEVVAILQPLRAQLLRHPEYLNSDTCGIHYWLAESLVRLNRFDEALDSAIEAIAAYEKLYGVDNVITAYAYQMHGTVLAHLKRYEESEKEMLRTLGIYQREFGIAHARTQLTLKSLVKLYTNWERPADAEKYRALLAAGSAGL